MTITDQAGHWAGGVNAMSIDVEEYFQVWALSSKISKCDWPKWPSRVEQSTETILQMLETHDAVATFFVLGCVAERHPHLVRRIVGAGHELASHGFWHDKVSTQTPEEFRQDILAAKHLLEDVGGTAVKGYRAPSFSIGDRQGWAYRVLAEAGYAYSSSLHPIRHDHYGRPDAPRQPYREGGGLWEIPVATVDRWGRRWTCAGGGHFRLLPYSGYSRMLWQSLARDGVSPSTFYFHPWEIDPGQPRVPGLPLRSQFRHYTGLSRMQAKLERLLRDFRWGRIDRVYGFLNDSGYTCPERQPGGGVPNGSSASAGGAGGGGGNRRSGE